jgi:hypothetical protein
MNRSIAALTLFSALCCHMATAHAAPRITIGPHPNLSLTGPTTLDVFYDISTGGGLMQGQTLYIAVADEGNGGGGSADAGEPKIIGIDTVTGTNWEDHINPPPYTKQLNNQLWTSIQTSTDISTYVAATGKAFSVTIDPNGASANSVWGLRVFIMAPYYGGPYPSIWNLPMRPYEFPFEFGDPIQFGTTPSGSFQYIPEPSAVVPATFALISLAAAAWRKRRKVDQR